MTYICKVYSGSKFLQELRGSSLPDLKRRATVLCDEHYNITDELRVSEVESECILHSCKFTRINKKYPDNIIVRGKWL